MFVAIYDPLYIASYALRSVEKPLNVFLCILGGSLAGFRERTLWVRRLGQGVETTWERGFFGGGKIDVLHVSLEFSILYAPQARDQRHSY